jgi:hypothetical protein
MASCKMEIREAGLELNKIFKIDYDEGKTDVIAPIKMV